MLDKKIDKKAKETLERNGQLADFFQSRNGSLPCMVSQSCRFGNVSQIGMDRFSSMMKSY